MFNTSVRASLLLLVAALAASAGSGQPPDAKKELPAIKGAWPYYTAFPDLKPPTVERKEFKTSKGNVEIVYEEKGVVPLPPLPAVAADASPLRKVQYEQVQAGFAYLAYIKEMIRIGVYTPQSYREYLDMALETYKVAAELEDQSAKRVPWYEARVRKLKEFERFTEIRVLNGTEPPQILQAVRFVRLQAEADLLKLKAEVEKAGGPVAPSPVPALVPAPPIIYGQPIVRKVPRLFHRR